MRMPGLPDLPVELDEPRALDVPVVPVVPVV